ncbi:ABC transporter permease [Clostridium oryzae]|uniref:ABC-2 type transporter n=1 Tax=Clostridium oryzae TaxID=1450648 RepID=A0A1V4IND1_9CLOT|nr:ABC transporter permease [Clostridium oryzae]OPJ61403.1 ABC-2 type transporter [Clostridium oryzae]
MNRLRTIAAVTRKDLTQFTRYPSIFLQLLIWPLIFPLVYILSAYALAGKNNVSMGAYKSITGTNNYMGFIVIGTMIYMWVNVTMWSFGTYLREEQTRGTLESNWLCPIKRFDMLIGGAVIGIIQGFAMAVVSMVEYRFVYNIHFTGNVLIWLLTFIIVVPGVYGIGSIFASLVLWVKETNSMVQLVRGMVMIFCGVSFPISVMPSWMQEISKVFPFTYGILAGRTLMINGGSLIQALPDIAMCLGEGIIYLIIGRLCFAAVERKVKLMGSLERF